MPDCSCTADGTLLLDVTDPTCKTDYLCYFEEANGPYYCESGEVFDSNIGVCIIDDGSFVCTPIECPLLGGCNCKCDASAHPSVTVIADRYDCSVYYMCNADDTVGHPYICPGSTSLFDGTQCQEDLTRCCSCRPYCPRELYFVNGEASYLVPDMTDCTKAFVCLEEYVIPDLQITCPAGEHFDLLVSDCSMTAPCLIMCANTVDSFTCQAHGSFPKCPQLCSPEYYYCSSEDIGHVVDPSHCPEDQYFHLNLHGCVFESDCDSYPPVTVAARLR